MNPYQTIQEIKDRARIEGAETIVADSCLHRLARFLAFGMLDTLWCKNHASRSFAALSYSRPFHALRANCSLPRVGPLAPHFGQTP
jgi:hypothetical protein